MQKISFGNKEYIKASEIAKQFRYTQDYVGQLCRNKKVDARRVGRIWYIEPDSVKAYRKTKHQTQKVEGAKIKLNKKPSVRVRDPKPVSPVVRSKTAKNVVSTVPRQNVKVNQLTVEYDKDSAAAIPILQRIVPRAVTKQSVEVVPVKVEPEKLVSIKVKTRKHTAYKTEKLPEISLSGKVKVGSLYSDFDPDADVKQKNKSKLASAKQHKVPSETPNEDVQVEKYSQDTTELPENTRRPITNQPKSIHSVESSTFTPVTAVEKPSKLSKRPPYFLYLTVIAVSLFFVIGCISAVAVITVGSEKSSNSIELRFENLRQIF